ncbi:hypothetical protein ASD15_30525 [Massilia sp. Root351]|uniref:DUF4175 family protein n=1 Tax=Massilia sp. Root351 TaxID=1736522 RepID=UPI00070BD600|nr:DUF4175 family protein [Massilia sp. Root351]KQV85368.1 hypothetical protein ASD15_30525 [Massilia sp. Root351]
MSADADFRSAVQRRLWRAILLRRAPLWAGALLPLSLLLARTALSAPGAPQSGPAALAPLVLLCAWLIWLVADLLALRRRVAAEWPRWLDAAVPALEDSSALLATEPATPVARLQRQRLQARLLDVLRDDDYRAIARVRVRHALLPIAASVLCAASAYAWQATQAGPAHANGKAAAGKAGPRAPGDIVLRVTPPGYTKAAPFESGAGDIQVPQHSQVRWCYKRGGEMPATIELSDGQTLSLTQDCAGWTATESLFWRVRGGSRHNIRVTIDQAPQASIVAPSEAIQVLPADARSVQLSVAARDDYGIVRASLHLTLARGSGENIRFSDREMPLPQSADPRTRNWQKNWSLAELGMEPGDELYFFLRATDNAPQPHTVQTPTYTLRLPGPQSESLDSSALPTMVKPESLRSQRQIIIDTEQLLADAPKLHRATLRERSEAIAGDQSRLRLRYGQFLGEESTLFGDDEHGHGDKHGDGHGDEDKHEGASAQRPGAFKDGGMASIVAEFGHKHDETDNATIFDPKTKEVLRRALKAMWDAEKQLRAVAPQAALAPEYRALDAIKELQQAERVYLHRTAFVPPAIKEEKRLTGDVVGAQSTRRAQGAAGDKVPQEVRGLVQALASGGALPALWSKRAREIIAAHIGGDEQKLAAQRAVQDVADGCTDCRAVLRAYLRATLTEPAVVLQAQPQSDSKFRQAWRGKEQP